MASKVVGPRCFRLRCAGQKYDWGKIGGGSIVCRLLRAQGSVGVSGDVEKTPFAEFWMGTHPNGPSVVVFDDGKEVPLSDFIASAPEFCLGKRVFEAHGAQLPFLLKARCLSVTLDPERGCFRLTDGRCLDRFSPFERPFPFRPIPMRRSLLRFTPALRRCTKTLTISRR